MKLSQLHPNEGQIAGVPKNPRYITEKDFRALKKSLTGFRKMLALRPIVIDEDFNILGGNMRYRALVKLAEEHAKVGAFEFTDEIPDEWVKQDCTLTQKEKREFVLKDNDEKGDWDLDLIANEWDELELQEWDMDMLPMDGDELDTQKLIDQASSDAAISEYSEDTNYNLGNLYRKKLNHELIEQIEGGGGRRNYKTRNSRTATHTSKTVYHIQLRRNMQILSEQRRYEYGKRAA